MEKMVNKILYDELVLFDMLDSIINQENNTMMYETAKNVDLPYQKFRMLLYFLEKNKFVVLKKLHINGHSTGIFITQKGIELYSVLKSLHKIIYEDIYKKELDEGKKYLNKLKIKVKKNDI